MARGRIISKTLSTSRKRAALHQAVPDLAEFCQQLYPLLVVHADDFGRLSGDPFTVKHAIDPTSPRPEADFDRGLNALHGVGLLVRYVADDRSVIQIWNFDQHQSNIHKRTKSSFPEPPDSVLSGVPEVSGTLPETSGGPPEGKGREGKGTELNRTEGKRSAPAAPPAQSGSSRTTPLVGRRRGNAAFEGQRGLYVPQQLHQQFIQLRHHDGAEGELEAWYARVCEQWATGDRRHENPNPDMFRFWTDRFAEQWPASKPGHGAPDRANPAHAVAKQRYGGMEFGK
jgi:hypothetical protein